MSEVKKPSGGFVFYPQAYCLGNDAHSSYAIGTAGRAGVACVVYLRPSESSLDASRNSSTAQTVPTLMEFAEQGRRARNPCLASPENGPANPEGMLLIEQATRARELEPQHGGLAVYIGRWASVLRESSEMPVALTGAGYLEIGFGRDKDGAIEELSSQYAQVVDAMMRAGAGNMVDLEQRRDQLYCQIMEHRKKWFVGVLIQAERTLSFEPGQANTGALTETLVRILAQNTVNGMYGGSMIRLRQGNTVLGDFCRPCNMQYDYAKAEVPSPQVIVDKFMRYAGNSLVMHAAKNGLSLDILPTQRVNCGSRGAEKYGRQMLLGNTSKVLKTYVDRSLHNQPGADYIKSNGFLFARVAMRLAVIGRGKVGEGNCLLSSIHAYSAPMGNIFTVGVDAKQAYQMDTDQARPRQSSAA